jgi:ribosomal protein S18 acetylase RimI-like enzyme
MSAAVKTEIAAHDPRRHDEVVALLVRAFVEDPLYRWFWPDAGKRLRGVRAFIGGEVRLSALQGRVDVAVDEGGRSVAAALWALPGRYPFPLLPSLRIMSRVMPRMGLSAARRLPWLKRVDRAHLQKPHWYLVTLGVEPALQRRGLGRSLVRARATEADRDGVPVYLETFNPANLPYYRALGFEDREAIDDGRLPPFWTLVRPPAAQA